MGNLTPAGKTILSAGLFHSDEIMIPVNFLLRVEIVCVSFQIS